MPEPIVEPITTASALQRPMRRCSPDGGVMAAAGVAGVVIPRNYAAALPAGSPSGDYSRMNAPFLTTLFWICAVAVAASQAMILRSTFRAWRTGGTRTASSEWVFAVVPAVALAAVLYLSWSALS